MLAYILMALFLICAVLLVLLILVQKGRGGGLAAAFGGGGGQSAFGTRTADVLTKITGGLALAFFLLSVVMAILLNPQRGVKTPPTGSGKPAATTPAPAPTGGGEVPAAPAGGGDAPTPVPTGNKPDMPGG